MCCKIVIIFHVYFILFKFFFQLIDIHIISAADFPLFFSNSARKCLILPAECSPQNSLILLEILPEEFVQAYPSLKTLSAKQGSILTEGVDSIHRDIDSQKLRTF